MDILKLVGYPKPGIGTWRWSCYRPPRSARLRVRSASSGGIARTAPRNRRASATLAGVVAYHPAINNQFNN